MFNFSASLPQSIPILPNGLNYSVPLHKARSRSSILTVECSTFKTVSLTYQSIMLLLNFSLK